MKKINTIILSVLIVFMALFAFLPVVLAADSAGMIDAKAGLKSSASEVYDTTGEYTETDKVTINTIVGKIITTALSLLGVIFLVLMIYGGFLWMTARGDEGQVTKAKDLMQAAIIGLVVVISAYAISYFVISTLSTGTLK